MRVKQKQFLFLLLFTLAFTLFSCSNPTDPRLQSSLTLTVEGVTSTEAFVKLSTSNVSFPASVTLSRNNKQINSFTLITADTTIVDLGLNPNQNYTYTAELTDANNQKAVSTSVIAQTMDTTSHNFTFETFTFGGQGGSSTLYDVAIIAENDIWAVGQMYVYDSTGSPILYNAVHWDGKEWKLHRIMFYTICGQENRTAYPAKAIFAVNEDEIWVAMDGDQIGILKNGLQTQIICLPWSFVINKIWGANSNDLYVVGNSGSIAHYNNGFWQKIESGTDLNIYDIWGDNDINKENYEINIVAAEHLIGQRRKILTIKNNSVEELQTSNISVGSLHSIWYKSGKKYFVVGNGIYTKNDIDNSNSWVALHNGLTPYYTYAIRGSSLNNIIICGSFGELLHFNGISWKTFRNTPGFYSTEFLSTDVKENIIIAVGYSSNKAFITIGNN